MKNIILIFTLLFLSNQFQLDAELRLIEIIEPGNFKADTGRFSDAYYVMTEAPVEVKELIHNDSNIDISNAKARVRIYQEKSDGSFDNEVFLERTIYFNISKQDSLVIDFNLASGEGEKFFPTTYYNILYNDSNFKYPEYFSKMLWNVTPRYLIEVELLNSNGGKENKQSRITRYYLNVADKFLLSVENSLIVLDSNSTSDQIAGHLNSKVLIDNFTNFSKYDREPYPKFSVFDRLNWGSKTTDYTSFTYLFWSDGDDKPIDWIERESINEFLEAGTTRTPKNLAICSQELAREHGKEGTQPDSVFISYYLRAGNCQPGNPKGKNISCDSIKIKGVSIAKDFISNIYSTGYYNDSPPYCGLININPQGEGLAKEAAIYYPDSIYSKNCSAGLSKKTLTHWLVFYSIDWRHFGDGNEMLRTILDYFDKNTSSSERKYFISCSRLDKNANRNYPGDTIKINYKYGYEYRDSMFDSLHTTYLDDFTIIVVNAVNKSVDTLISDTNGYAFYTFIIPFNTLPGFYQFYYGIGNVTNKFLFDVKKPFFTILGDNNSCELQSKNYRVYKSDYQSLIWQITNGTILSYNSDSTEITVQWGESGEGKINLEMFKDGETKQLELNVTINPKPEKPLITQVENILKSTSSFRYQWYFNNELIEGATDSIYEPQESGYYSVIITNINGCASEISEQIYFEKTINVEEKKLNKPYMEISPNPATDYIEINVWVRHAVPIENREIQIYNIYGEKIPVEAHCPDIIGMPLRIDVSNFPTGIYFIHFRNEIQKIVVIR